MNNQIPYMDGQNMQGFNMQNPNFGGQNVIWVTLERFNNRISRLERQVRILENRVDRLTSNQTIPFKNSIDEDNMYML
jgi:hypothetical protein